MDLSQCMAMIDGFLDQAGWPFQRASDGPHLRVPWESTAVRVDVIDGAAGPVVRLFARVLRHVSEDVQLVSLLEANVELQFARFSFRLDDRVIGLQYDLHGPTVGFEELTNAIAAVGSTATEWAPQLIAKFGGQRDTSDPAPRSGEEVDV